MPQPLRLRDREEPRGHPEGLEDASVPNRDGAIACIRPTGPADDVIDDVVDRPVGGFGCGRLNTTIVGPRDATNTASVRVKDLIESSNWKPSSGQSGVSTTTVSPRTNTTNWVPSSITAASAAVRSGVWPPLTHRNVPIAATSVGRRS